MSCNGGAPAACGALLATAVAGGGDIYICPGVYQGNFTLNTLPVNLYGAGSGGDASVDTILDGDNAGIVVAIVRSGAVTLEGLRIINGLGPRDEAGGISSPVDAMLTINDCTIRDNEGNGAGAILTSGSTSITNSRIVANVSNGAGPGGINLYTNTGTVTSRIASSEISGNSGGLDGGGIRTTAHTLTFTSVDISGNSGADGGGVFIRPANAEAIAFDSACQIVANVATSGGAAIGGIDNRGSGSVALNGATVSGNTPVNCANVTGC